MVRFVRSVAIALTVLTLTACSRSHAVPSPAPYEFDEQRERWFMEQREYPFGEVPQGARAQAFRFTQHMEMAADAFMSATGAPSRKWVPLGPSPVSVSWKKWQQSNGRIVAIAVSPLDPRLVLIAGSSGGIWRSTDAGNSFVAVTDDQVDLSVGAITFAPSDPNVVYAGMGGEYLGTGVLKSTDAGKSWTRVSNADFPPRGRTERLIVDALNPNHVLLAQSARQDGSGSVWASGVLLSDDGGVSWRTTLYGWIQDMVVLPANPSTIVATAGGVYSPSGSPSGLYRSNDGGRSWTPLTSGPFDQKKWISGRLATSAAAPQEVYWYAVGTVPEGTRTKFFRSSDGGSTWSEKVSSTLPENGAIFEAVSPADPETIYLGLADLYRSNDGGLTWTNVTRGYIPNFDPMNSLTHVDQHAIAFGGNDGKSVYLGNDGGLFLSRDATTTFQSLSGAMGSLVQFYSVSAGPLDPNLVLGGSQDNGLTKLGSGTTWREVITGDYRSLAFGLNDPSIFVVGYVYGSVYRFKSNGDRYDTQVGKNSAFGESDSSPRMSFLPPMTIAANGTLYFGTWRLYSSTDMGTNWTEVGSSVDLTSGVDKYGNGDVLSVIATASTNPSVIYTGSARGRVMRTADGGVNWTDVTAGLPNRSITAITPVGDGTIAYVAVSGFATQHVYKTVNGGSSWTPASLGLPDIPINAVWVDRENPTFIYAGSDIGVFWSTSGGDAWLPLRNGMPPVPVLSFTRTADGRLIAGSYGRGAYVLTTEAPQPARRRAVHR